MYPIAVKTLQLIKIKVTAAVSFSAAAGFFLFDFRHLQAFVLMLAGIFLQAGAASALNQLQERQTDALMRRTHLRPLATGVVAPRYVLWVVLVMLISGTLLLAANSWLPALLGLLNVLLYNGLYTPLKRHSMTAAVLIGAFVGAIPPLIGWSSAGGSLLAPVILMVAGFMYLWQIPHFGLLALKHTQDYQNAGYAVRFQPVQIKQIIFTSLLLLMLQVSGFVLLDMVHTPLIIVLLAAFSLLMLFLLYTYLFTSRPLRRIFGGIPLINMYMMLLLILLLIDQAIRF